MSLDEDIFMTEHSDVLNYKALLNIKTKQIWLSLNKKNKNIADFP